MKQKADHHLTFLAEKNDRSASNILKHLPSRTSVAPSSGPSRPVNGDVNRPATHASTSNGNVNGTGNGNGNGNVGEEDAAGESDDGIGESEARKDFQNGAKMDVGDKLAEGNQLPECEFLTLMNGARVSET